MKRFISGLVAVVFAVGLAVVAVPSAMADSPPPAGQVDGGVSSAALSSWETDGPVFSLAYGNGVVYAGGTFGNALPPGTASGSTTGEVARTYLAAFSSTTGALITSFDPTISYSGSDAHPGIFAMALSPDGSTLYVGGVFSEVDGVARSNVAAFNTSTGALTSWDPYTASEVRAIAVSPDGSSIYLGGVFTHMDYQTRTFAAAVNTAGKLLPWAPNLDSSVYALAVAPDDSQVLLGGYFQHVNGVAQNSIAAVDPVNGTSWPWGLPGDFIPHNSGCQSSVKDIVISGGTAYIADEGNGGGCFDGDWALSLGSTDQLKWLSNCLGATQALAVVNGYLFKGSHAHDCAWSPGGWPEVRMADGTRIGWHLLDQSLADGTIQHWTPNTNVGFASQWQGTDGLGPHAMATDGSRLFVGGDFTTVNNKPQQGIAIFPSGQDPQAPANPTAAPTVSSPVAGTDLVSFPATWSRDVGTLSYKIYRDGGSSPIATVTATSWPQDGDQPVVQYRDTGLAPGSTHTYTYQAYDGIHNTAKSPASAPVTVASSSPSQTYQQTVLADNPSFLWPLNDSGGTAADASGNGFNGTYEPGTTQGASGPFTGSSATTFDGNTGLVTSQNQVTGPQVFSVELWFKTTTIDGGKLVGFGSNQTGSSGSYDRHIYMMNDGQLTFGIWNNQTETIETPHTYNDGQWHYVVATYDASGNMALYVDGQLIGTNSTSSAQAYSGYWRVGGDNLNGWNLDPWGGNSQGTTQPASFYFNGTIADVAVYPTALSAGQVAAHYAAGVNQQ